VLRGCCGYSPESPPCCKLVPIDPFLVGRNWVGSVSCDISILEGVAYDRRNETLGSSLVSLAVGTVIQEKSAGN